MEETAIKNHSIIVEDRKKFNFTGVKDVLSFDEETVMLETALGKLAVKGTGLHILNFRSETGDLSGEGKVHALIYTVAEDRSGLFSRLFK